MTKNDVSPPINNDHMEKKNKFIDHPSYFHTSWGSGETAWMRRLAWAFAGRLCDKYHNLMSWLIYANTITWLNVLPEK